MNGAVKSEHKLAAELSTSEEAYEQARENVDAAHSAAAVKAAEALQAAIDRHDAATAEADRVAQAAVAEATAARAQEREQALAAFDDEMRREYEAPDARVVTTPSGVLEMRSGRTLLAGVVPQGLNLWRVDTPGGAIFVPGEAQARRLLWSTLRPDDDESAAVA